MAKNILRVLRDNEYFYLHDGSVIKSVKGLPAKIKAMDDGLFRYHVNQERNDLANWIGFLSDDLELKGRMTKCLEKNDMIKILKAEIENLTKISTAVQKAQLPIKNMKVEKKKAVAVKKVAKKKAPANNKAPKKKTVKSPAKRKAVKRGKKKYVREAPGITAKSTSEYITSGIKEYLLGIITGLILGLIIGAML